MEDADFLTQNIYRCRCDILYMAPHISFTDPANSASMVFKQSDQIANNYVHAIRQSGVKRVVYLSSVGADMVAENGFIKIHHQAEQTFNQLPGNVNVSFMRAVGFLKNLFAFIPRIKRQGIIAASYGGDDRNLVVSDIDMADAIAEELESHETGRKMRYIASEEIICNEVAKTLGAAIGKPDLQWLTVTNEQQMASYNLLV